MDFILLTKLIELLLADDKRVSVRYLRRQFQLDDATFDDLCHELMVTRGVALLEDDEILVRHT